MSTFFIYLCIVFYGDADIMLVLLCRCGVDRASFGLLVGHEPRRRGASRVRQAQLGVQINTGGPSWEGSNVAAIGDDTMLLTRVEEVEAREFVAEAQAVVVEAQLGRLS